MAGILAILAAAAPIIQAGATIFGGSMQNKAVEEANKKNLEIYEKQVANELAAQKSSEKLQTRQLGLSEQIARWNKKQQTFENERSVENDNYAKMQSAADKYAEMLNSGDVTRQNRMTGFQRG